MILTNTNVLVHQGVAQVKRTYTIVAKPGGMACITNGFGKTLFKDSVRAEIDSPFYVTKVIVSANVEPNIHSLYKELTGMKTFPLDNNVLVETVSPPCKVAYWILQEVENKLQEHQLDMNTKEALIRAHNVYLELHSEDSFEAFDNVVNKVTQRIKLIGRNILKVGIKIQQLQDIKTKVNKWLHKVECPIHKSHNVNYTCEEQDRYESMNICVYYEANEDIEPQEALMTVYYVLKYDGWKPFYVAHIDSNASTMRIDYSAKLKHSTGEDWENANVTLTTALLPGYEEEISQVPTFSNRWIVGKEHCVTSRLACDEVDAPRAPCAVPSSRLVAGVFEIEETCTLISQTEPIDLKIAEIHLPVTFKRTCCPKLSETVHITCKATNTSDFMLLEGPCNVYVGSEVTSLSTMPFAPPQSKIEMELGIDPFIRVSYLPKETYSDVTEHLLTFSPSAKNYLQRVLIENYASLEVPVFVVDQLPVSESRERVVSIIEPQNYTKEDLYSTDDEELANYPVYYKDLGILKRLVNLNPQSSMFLNNEFSIAAASAIEFLE